MQIRDRIVELRRVPASQLAPNPRNWRTHPKAQADALRGVLSEIGIAGAVLARKRDDGVLELIDGHLRAETLGDGEVPVLVLDVDEAEALKLLATYDPLSAMAEADPAILDDLLREVSTSNAALAAMLAEMKDESGGVVSEDIVEDEVPEPPSDPITKPGDLWLLGEHRLLCGDSTNAEDVERLMGSSLAAMVATDPPYGMGGYAGRSGNHDAVIGDDKSIADFLGTVPRDITAWVWCDWRSYPTLVREMGQPTAVIVWVKEWPTMGRGYRHRHEFAAFYGSFDSTTQSDVIEGAYKASGVASTWQRTATMQQHPTQKPVECMAIPIRNHTQTGELVYDPFLGSGTTLIAAEQLGRKCYGMEISPAYCDVIVKRWETLTGKKATRG